MKIIPINDNIIIKPVVNELKSKSGIVLPESSKKETQLGEVIFVDSEILKKGDVVIYTPFSLEEVEIEKEKYLVGKTDVIIGVIDNG